MNAAQAMEALRGMMAKSCNVVRDSVERTLDPALLVPGDIVRLRLGERVPADMRVIVTRDLKTEVRPLRTVCWVMRLLRRGASARLRPHRARLNRSTVIATGQ